jgi:hypothetical protein
MRCQENQAITDPEDWCPEADTERMRTWIASYRVKVAEDRVCTCCGKTPKGEGQPVIPTRRLDTATLAKLWDRLGSMVVTKRTCQWQLSRSGVTGRRRDA